MGDLEALREMAEEEANPLLKLHRGVIGMVRDARRRCGNDLAIRVDVTARVHGMLAGLDEMDRETLSAVASRAIDAELTGDGGADPHGLAGLRMDGAVVVRRLWDKAHPPLEDD